MTHVSNDEGGTGAGGRRGGGCLRLDDVPVELTNPSKVGPFIKELVGKAAAELKKQGLIR